MSPSEQFMVIREALRDAVGQDHAVPINTLAFRIGSSRRQVEMILESRLPDFGFALVSGSKGYYRPTSPDDLNHYLRQNVSRMRCLFIRNRTVREQAEKEGWTQEDRTFVTAPKQLTLSFSP